MLVSLAALPAISRPDLVPGEWKDISPAAAQINLTDPIFYQGMAIDPNDPSVLYLCICGYDVAKPVGLYKAIDGGSTWKRVGNLDEPIHIAIDPADSKHLYAVDGVRGNTLGFWVSHDGGEPWAEPDGFVKASVDPVGIPDLYSLSVEPGNFDHVLVSFKTWLFTAQAGGFFRTADGGTSWSLVYDKQMTHGGNQIYCSKSGVLYSGGYQYPTRSADGGKTWTQVTTGLDYSWYMGITGDGKTLYTAGVGDGRPFFVSPESDGGNWSAYRKGAQTFSAQEPFEMFCDTVNGIVYSANWGGLLALKTAPEDAALRPRALAWPGGRIAEPSLSPTRSGILARDRKGNLYSVPGRRVTGSAPAHP